MTSRQFFRAIVLWLWTIIMSASLVLGGIPLKALRRDLGRVGYWCLGIATVGLLFAVDFKAFSAFYLSLVLLVGLFAEWEELGMSLMASAFFSVVTTVLVSAAGVALWISRIGAQWKDLIITRIDDAMKLSATASLGELTVNSNDLLLQLPSIFIVLWLLTLYFAVMLDRKPVMQSRHAQYEVSFREELARINIPNAVIWVFILALLGAFGEFGKLGLQAAAVNVLNVCMVLFVFQGLAVIFRCFTVFRVGFIWQALAMVILVSQLWLVGLLGLVDHWVDFRTRLSKSREQMNNELQ